MAYELLHRGGALNGAELSAFLTSDADEGEGEQERGIKGEGDLDLKLSGED